MGLLFFLFCISLLLYTINDISSLTRNRKNWDFCFFLLGYFVDLLLEMVFLYGEVVYLRHYVCVCLLYLHYLCAKSLGICLRWKKIDGKHCWFVILVTFMVNMKLLMSFSWFCLIELISLYEIIIFFLLFCAFMNMGTIFLLFFTIFHWIIYHSRHSRFMFVQWLQL